MYHGLGEVWLGFTKNMFSAFSGNLPLFTLVLIFVLCTQVLPILLAITGFLTHAPWRFLAVGSYLISVAIRLILCLKFESDNPLNASLSPLAWAVALGIGANSAICGMSKAGTFWKGRSYGAKLVLHTAIKNISFSGTYKTPRLGIYYRVHIPVKGF